MTHNSIRWALCNLGLALALAILLAGCQASARAPDAEPAESAQAATDPKAEDEPVPSKPMPTPQAPADAGVGDKDEPIQPAKQTRRYLFVKNLTDSKLAVFLQYRTETRNGDWQWFPADPRQSTEALRFDLKPGQETYLEDEGWIINASRVRIWAVAESGKEWNDYKPKDLWLVPEVDKAGKHIYLARDIETHPQPFGP